MTKQSGSAKENNQNGEMFGKQILKNLESYHTEEGMDLFPSEVGARTKGLKL